MTEFYVTFGQVHKHEVDGKVFDKDCVGVVCADSHLNARIIIEDCFGDKFCTSYAASTFTTENMKHYPRGFIRVN